ncbi:dethiobiotin synthase [bacterium]|nr:dethiobiotin synthase [bacterium]
MDGVFITGVDTNVGKTVIAAGILKLLHGTHAACYWKPVQTGTVMGDDTNDVQAITELGSDCFMDPVYRFPEPLAPRHAAQKWGKQVEMSALVSAFESRPRDRVLVIEGAGGLLVPLNDKDTQRDLIKRLGLPAILVAEDRVGSINHTLLTLEACRAQNIQVLGVILTKTKGTLGNADSITHFGKTEILADIPLSEDKRSAVAQVSCHPRLRKLFGVTPIPV